MKTKTCSICKKSLAENSSGYCKPCNRAYGRANYRANKERYFAKAKERDAMIDSIINEHKDVPCADCGIKYPHYVMDFDHLPQFEKYMDISKMKKRRMAIAKIVAEIAKCEVVCSNCHRERSNRRNPSRFSKIAFVAL